MKCRMLIGLLLEARGRIVGSSCSGEDKYVLTDDCVQTFIMIPYIAKAKKILTQKQLSDLMLEIRTSSAF